jgi:hypothetical protein
MGDESGTDFPAEYGLEAAQILEERVLAWVAAHQAEVAAVEAEPGGLEGYQEAFDAWIVRRNYGPREIYDRTIFLLERCINHEPLDLEAALADWQQRTGVPDLLDPVFQAELEAEGEAHRKMFEQIRSWEEAHGEELDARGAEPGAMDAVLEARLAWVREDKATPEDMPARMELLYSRWLARKPIDVDSLRSAWAQSQ